MYMSVTATKNGFFLYGGLKDDLKTANNTGAFLDFRDVWTHQKPSIFDKDFIVEVESEGQPAVDQEIISAAIEGDLERVKAFFSDRRYPNHEGASLLHVAADFGNTELLAGLLPHFEDINLWDEGRGATALYDSGRAPTTDAMKLLLDRGADPYSGCMNGSAVDGVVRWSKPSYLGVLIRNGIDVNKPKDTCKWRPEEFRGLVIHSWVRNGQYDMHQEMKTRHEQVGEQLFLAGIHLHSVMHHDTSRYGVLSQSARFDGYSDVEWLVYRGADHEFVDHDGNTAEDLADDKEAYKRAYERGIARRR